MIRVIVTTHNAISSLKNCLSSIQCWTDGIPYRLSVVDDASSDGTPDFLRTIVKRDKVEYHLFSRNIGKAAAINYVVEKDRFQSDWYVLLDDDAEVTPNWLSVMLKAAMRHPSAAIIGCRIVFPDRKICSAEIRLYDPGAWREEDSGHRNYSRFCDGLTSVCLLIRADVFKKVRFWEKLRQRWEDVDFCLSARKERYRIFYCGEVAVKHKHLFRTPHLELKNREIVWSKWKIPCFPDSHPVEKTYAIIKKSVDRDQWNEVLAQSHLLLRHDYVSAYAWQYIAWSLYKMGFYSTAQLAIQRALFEKYLNVESRVRLQAWLLYLSRNYPYSSFGSRMNFKRSGTWRSLG